MASRGAGASVQSLTVLQRTARLYEGERWWLYDQSGEVRGLLLFDGGEDLACVREEVGMRASKRYRFSLEDKGKAPNAAPPAWARQDSGRSDCQVTVEERNQLFGFLKKG
jgi:hypothetical protein